MQSGTSPMTILIACLVVAAGAVWVALWSWRGWPVGGHPYCRRCGFDLTGRPAESTRCSECGAELSAKKAIRIGERSLRHAWFWPAVMVGLVAAGLGGVASERVYVTVGLWHYAPEWWLMGSFERAGFVMGEPAVTEVLKRIEDKRLSEAAGQRVLEGLIAWQCDRSRPWKTVDGYLLQLLLRNGVGSDEQWQRVLENSLPFAVRARSRIRAGDDWRVEVLTEWRGGEQVRGKLTACALETASGRVIRLPLPDSEFRLPALYAVMSPMNSVPSWQSQATFEFLDSELEAVAGKEVRITVHLVAEITDRSRSSRMPVVTKRRTVRASFPLKIEVVPAGADSVVAVWDEALRGQLEGAVTVVAISSRGEVREFRLSVDKPRVGLACRVFLQTGDEPPVLLDRHVVVCEAGGSVSDGFTIRRRAGAAQTIILRPDVGLARGSTSLLEYADMELRIPVPALVPAVGSVP